MYDVSDAFKRKMKEPVHHKRLTGKLGTMHLSSRNFIDGTVKISYQCSDNNDIDIGQVYVGELSCTIRNVGLPRNSYKGKELLLYEGLLLDDDTYEDIPLGKYYIDTADWSAEGIVIKAYNNMAKFDKKLTLNSSTGKIYDFIIMACNRCGVEFGMDAFEVGALPNGDQILSVYEENDIETWRDLLHWCAQTCGCNALISRDGKLYLVPYNQKVVDTYTSTQRLEGGKFSDFETRYTGVSMVNIVDQTTKYYGLALDDGLTLNLGQNPLVQYGLPETLDAQRQQILNAISMVDYTPCETKLHAPMVYDLMDVLEFSGGMLGSDVSVRSCITKFEWTYGKQYKIVCVGANPALSSARSKVDKDISGLLSKMSEDVMHYYDYLNAASIHIDDGDTAQIIFFRYVTTKNTHIDFHGEVKYQLSVTGAENDDNYSYGDGKLVVTYFLNGDEITDYHPQETKTDGIHLLHLMYTWMSSGNVIGTFKVNLKAVGGDIDIDVSSSRAYIAGQGLAGDDVWDGNINLYEDFSPIYVGVILKKGSAIQDSVAVTKPAKNDKSGLADSFRAINVKNVLLSKQYQFSDSLNSIYDLHRFAANPANVFAVGVEYQDVEIVNSKWQLISTVTCGSLTTPARHCDKITKVTSTHSGDDILYIVSFDEGVTWWTYNDGVWAEPDYTLDVYGMFEYTMRDIPEAKWAEKLVDTLRVRAILFGSATVTDIQIYTDREV